jgi:hypothetical protein
MRVLIVATGWNNRGALATSRALAKAGWEVGCATWDLRGLLATSRSISRLHRAPPPTTDLDGFVAATATAMRTAGYEAVLPSSDAETFALSLLRDRLPVPLPYPPHEAVLGAFDKLELTRTAAGCGIGTPWTAPATEAAVAAVEGPVVVKVRFHWNPDSVGMPGRWRTYVCADREEARRRVAQLRAAGGDPLLQELVRGQLLHCHVLVDRGGELVAAIQQRSEPVTETPLTWPPGAGVRTRSITVPLDAELVERITVLLRRLGWFGFAGLMFIVGAAPAVKTGVRYQWLWGDLRRAAAEGRGGRAADLIGCLAYARGASHGIWSSRDPWPAIRSWQRNLGQLAHRLPKAPRSGRGRSAIRVP